MKHQLFVIVFFVFGSIFIFSSNKLSDELLKKRAQTLTLISICNKKITITARPSNQSDITKAIEECWNRIFFPLNQFDFKIPDDINTIIIYYKNQKNKDIVTTVCQKYIEQCSHAQCIYNDKPSLKKVVEIEAHATKKIDEVTTILKK